MIGVCSSRKPRSLEEVVDRARGGVAHAQHRAERVRARPQVRDRAQELEAVALLLERVVVADVADAARARAARSSKRWPAAGRLDQLAARLDRAAGAQRAAPRARSSASSGAATTWRPARHEPSFSSRNETPFPWRAVRSQPCTRTLAPGRAPASISRIDSFIAACARPAAGSPSCPRSRSGRPRGRGRSP